MSTNVKSYTDKQLLDRVKTLPTYQGFPIGYFVIYVRSNEDEVDKFDDKKYTYYKKDKDSEPEFIQVDACTTHTGKWGLKNFSTYNKDGAAVLQADHMVYDAFVRGETKGRPAYRENKAWGHYRDNNKNDKSEEIGKIYYTKIYAHIHGIKSKYNKIDNIGKWSLACLVDNDEDVFQKWYDMLEGQKYVTAVILNEF